MRFLQTKEQSRSNVKRNTGTKVLTTAERVGVWGPKSRLKQIRSIWRFQKSLGFGY